MKRKILSLAAISIAAAMHAASNDPVLMTVDGKDVHVSEFEYLYNKNNTQQMQPQTLDEYLGMFVNYKLKVADALREGLDRTPEFTAEYESFVKDLAKPYFRDDSVAERLVQQAYSHFADDVLASHIMLPLQTENVAKLDSIKSAIAAGSLSFEDAARQFSVDRYSAQQGGLMGYVVPGRFPWAFEEAAYSTPTGSVSDVVNSGMGYHLVRVEKRTPAQGEVEAEHILLLTRGLDDAQAAAKKELADSLYKVAKGGADFADLARRFSEDPGSAQKGGKLGWFGRGAMVAEFDSASFALTDGAISQPVKTSFGWHIIHRTNHRGVPALADVRESIEAKIASDERGALPEKAVIARLRKTYNVEISQGALDQLRAVIDANNGSCDSTVLNRIIQMDPVVATYSGGELHATEAIARVPDIQMPVNPMAAITSATNDLLDDIIIEKEQQRLASENADFRNLLNEYHDGILLYEVSNRKVWDKAANDREGLEKFFRAHASDYKWESPKFKSYVIFAASDSTLNQALVYADSLSTENPTEFVRQMREQFKRDIKIERVVAAKGENAITDYLGFGAERPADGTNSRWKYYAAYKGRIINAPEEAADVRGTALTDYQSALDKEWIKDLHKKYKVKINNKVFNNLKKKK